MNLLLEKPENQFAIPYKSRNLIPMDEYKKLHREYWKNIAKKGFWFKPIIVSDDGHPISTYNRCFACMYRNRIVSSTNMLNAEKVMTCKGCPLQKGKAKEFKCESKFHPYFWWTKTHWRIFAYIIAYLPWYDHHKELYLKKGD